MNVTLLFVSQTAEKLIRTFAEQIFYTGFIHADPHPGNGQCDGGTSSVITAMFPLLPPVNNNLRVIHESLFMNLQNDNKAKQQS